MPTRKKKNTPSKRLLTFAGLFAAGSVIGAAFQASGSGEVKIVSEPVSSYQNQSVSSETSETEETFSQLLTAETVAETVWTQPVSEPAGPDAGETETEKEIVPEPEAAPLPITEAGEEPAADWWEGEVGADAAEPEEAPAEEVNWFEPAPVPEPEPVVEPEPEWMEPMEPVVVPEPSSEADWMEPEQILRLVSVTSPVSRNETATLTVLGKPFTEYCISVYYSTTVSQADGLEAKVSDADGTVSWSWKVGGRTNGGSHRIVIEGGGETLETSFVTTE
ncbi:MAG: hypothetical protein ACI4V1_02510 [Eubacteriales bacterium]